MFYKNLKLYRVTDVLNFGNQEQVEQQLQQFCIKKCGVQDLSTTGWTSVIPRGKALLYAANGVFAFCLAQKEKHIPAKAITELLNEKVEAIEAETGEPVTKKAQQDLKQEIIHQVLPNALTTTTYIHGFYLPRAKLIAVDTSSQGKAETFLAMLRKSLGSLPVMPLFTQSLETQLTDWLKNQVPKGIQLLEDAALVHPDSDGGSATFKNHDLTTEEVYAHLNEGMLVQSLSVEWDETLSCSLHEDGSIKKIRFSDVIKEQNEDIPKEQWQARFDADLALAVGEINRFVKDLHTMFGLQEAA